MKEEGVIEYEYDGFLDNQLSPSFSGFTGFLLDSRNFEAFNDKLVYLLFLKKLTLA